MIQTADLTLDRSITRVPLCLAWTTFSFETFAALSFACLQDDCLVVSLLLSFLPALRRGCSRTIL